MRSIHVYTESHITSFNVYWIKRRAETGKQLLRGIIELQLVARLNVSNSSIYIHSTGTQKCRALISKQCCPFSAKRIQRREGAIFWFATKNNRFRIRGHPWWVRHRTDVVCDTRARAPWHCFVGSEKVRFCWPRQTDDDNTLPSV